MSITKLMMYVSFREHPDVFRDFFLRYPSIDLSDGGEFSRSPFAEACSRGDDRVVEVFLCQARLDVNQRNTFDGLTPLMEAIIGSHGSVICRLIDHPAVLLDIRSHKNGCSAFALAYDNANVLMWLIASGKSLGWTAADEAREWRHEAITDHDYDRSRRYCRDLIDRFLADEALTRHELRLYIDAPDAMALSVFAAVIFLSDGLLAINDSNDRLKRLAVRQGVWEDTRRFLCITQRLPLELQMLLCNVLGGSPKPCISSADSEPAFRYLGTIYGLNETLLKLARSREWESVMSLARRFAAESFDPNYQDGDGFTLLHCACTSGSVPFVVYLYSRSDLAPDMSLVDRKWGNTALNLACREGHAAIVQILVQSGFDIIITLNSANFEGSTPLSNACLMGHIEVVKVLLAERDQFDIHKSVPHNGVMLTPRDIAIASGNLDITALFEGVK